MYMYTHMCLSMRKIEIIFNVSWFNSKMVDEWLGLILSVTYIRSPRKIQDNSSLQRPIISVSTEDENEEPRGLAYLSVHRIVVWL